MPGLETVVVIDAVRTPIGRYGGGLSSIRPDDLAAKVIRAILDRNPAVVPEAIEDVLMGCANQAGEDNRNVARMAVLLAGLPVSVPAGTVNRLCGSGLMAVNQAAQSLAVGEGEIFIAGGVESMSRAPFVMGKPDAAFPRGEQTLFDTTLGWRFTNPSLAKMYYPYSMGETAENVAKQYQIARADQDQFAYDSQQKYQAALAAKRFESEILPVQIPQKKGESVWVNEDEHPRGDTMLEKLATLKPAFAEGGTVTAGNSSGINDGAAAVLLMTESKAKSLGLTPMARFKSTAVAGVEPATMGIGPIPATRKALQRAGLSVSDLDLIELNEAFAAQSLACIRELGLSMDKVNPNGGAIALGHPLGCSGARILTTLVHEMKRRPEVRFGLATMCIGVGQGIATILESVS
jgi:3-oxoadipyl-CoA thiolase